MNVCSKIGSNLVNFNIFEKLLPPKTNIFYDFFEDAAKNAMT